MCAIACVATVAGCGGGDEDPKGSIPSEAGNAIVDQLDELDAQVEAGKCADAEATAQDVQSAVADLQDLEEDLEQALVRASDNLVIQTREDCKEPEPDPEPETPPTGTSDDAGVLEDGEG